MSSSYPQKGTVYLVGAGPGDPELISVRGLRLLKHADVVIYDRLVHPALVDTLPEHTERIFVGKAPGQQMLPQDGIHVLLVERARQGFVVVRLKGGDPFVFGRGGEECQSLAESGVPFEVVPGVSSAVAVPAYAGIPVTHRGITQGFSVFTGFSKEPYKSSPDWPALARAGTLVVMMGLRKLPDIVKSLLKARISPSTPVAVISYGTTADQEVVEAPLAEIAGRVAHLKPPATIVVGEVVSLRNQLSWFNPSVDPSYDDVFSFPELDTLTAITQPLNNDQ